jgi:hypothetical protein
MRLALVDLLIRRSAPTLREGAWESVYGVIRTASFILGRRVRAALLSRLLSRRVPCLARVLRVAQLAAYLGSVGVSWLICAVVELSSRTSRQSSTIRSPLRPQDPLPA